MWTIGRLIENKNYSRSAVHPNRHSQGRKTTGDHSTLARALRSTRNRKPLPLWDFWIEKEIFRCIHSASCHRPLTHKRRMPGRQTAIFESGNFESVHGWHSVSGSLCLKSAVCRFGKLCTAHGTGIRRRPATLFCARLCDDEIQPPSFLEVLDRERIAARIARR